MAYFRCAGLGKLSFTLKAGIKVKFGPSVSSM
ncbi:MAG: hypothetical protein JWQ49_103 [Edaphobacter sp.]|nr:hypothetical protein [Edaphobacter sp.]